MAEFPVLPVFTDSLIADTTDMSALQFGAYFLLLMMAWRTKENALPDNDEKLARWARLDRRTWLSQKENILSRWNLEDGMWRQGRLDDERKRAVELRSKNADAGRASSLKRQGRHSTNVQPKSNETPTPLTSPLVEGEECKHSSPPLPPKPENLFSENLGEKNPKEKKSGRKASSFIADDFEADLGDIALAESLGLDAKRERDEFVDYWKGVGKKMSDWNAVFRNRLRQVAKYRAERAQNASARNQQGSGSIAQAGLRVAARYQS